MKITLDAIGLISTDHADKEQAPVQGVFRPDAVGTVTVFPGIRRRTKGH